MQSKEGAPLLADVKPEYGLGQQARTPSRRTFTQLWRRADSTLPIYATDSHHESRGWKVTVLYKTLPGWPAKRNPAYQIRAKHGAVAAENIICSEIGVDVLKSGGNAVDAAISTTLCVGVVNMFSSGIGGGGIMTVRLPPAFPGGSSEGWAVDFRETAPAAANSTMFSHDPRLSKYGGLSVGVPGELRGLAEAHRRWGTIPWKRLVKPVAQLAEGWEVGRELESRIQRHSELMLGNPDWSAIFAPHGYVLRQGDLIRRMNLARTLHTIAEEGAEAFYKGPILNALLKKIHETGGVLTANDFAQYTPKVTPALQGSYKNRRVYTTQAPSSGPVLLHMLNLLERFDDNDDVGKGLKLHRFVETMKTKICDPAFVNVTAGKTLIDEIPTKAYAGEIFRNISDDTTHPPEYYNPIYDAIIDHGTSHSSIVDASGMVVSITSTVNIEFGSQVLDPVTGVILNDELDDFSTPGEPNAYGLWPSPYNYPAPGKRPLSSMSPVIIEHPDGSFYLAAGAAGGSRIFSAVAEVILGADSAMSAAERTNDDWIDISSAVEGPRVHNQLFPLYVDMDSTFDQESIDALQARGHNITVSDINRVAAVAQAILAKDGKIFAASDSRKNGQAAGY
ncbi:gamma-glutamyltranspeptidase [Ramaria rubella]|nr:gamma-glutamyltranspeptidase [Ramaria rubella]